MANPSPAIPGQDLNYTILVTNTGPSDAQNVTVTDTLPASYTLALVTSSQGGCASVPCTLGTIVAGGNATMWINGKVAAGATGSVTNTVTVTEHDARSEVVFTVTTSLTTGADLVLVKTGTPTANPGDTVAYTVTVRNLGPSDAANVIITDTLPGGPDL